MLTYKKHAIKRMRQRGISETEVNHCLNYHHICYTDKKGNPIYIADTPNGRRIKVVVAKDEPNTIITVA